MGSEFINGAKHAFSTSLSDRALITAMSNAANAVATVAGPPPAVDSILLLTGMTNWTDLDEQATYVSAVNGQNVTLSQIDTRNEQFFVEGEGDGGYQIAGNFVTLSQIRDITQSGGDSNTFNYAYIGDRSRRQRSKPTDTNPIVLTFTMDYDSELPWYDALDQISQRGDLVVMRETLPTGDVLLYSGYMSFNKSPTRVRNENMTVVATMSVNSEVLRFPAELFAGS